MRGMPRYIDHILRSADDDQDWIFVSTAMRGRGVRDYIDGAPVKDVEAVPLILFGSRVLQPMLQPLGQRQEEP